MNQWSARVCRPIVGLALLLVATAITAPAWAQVVVNRSTVVSEVASTTDSNLACFSGTGGKRVKDCGTISGAGGVPSSRTVSTTAPLGGGGALSSNLTLTCTTCVTTARTISTTTPLGGGGALSGDLTLTCSTCALGAASSTDNTIPRFDGTGGKQLQTSSVVITDNDRLELPANASGGLAVYNVAAADRVLLSSASNIFSLYSEANTGTQRAFRLGASNGYIETGSSSGTYTFGGASLARLWTQSAATFQFANSITTQTTAGYEFTGLGSLAATSGTQTWFKINPVLNQASGSAATDILRIEPTLTAVGSGGADAISVAPGGTEAFRVTTGGQAVVNASTAPPASGAATSCILVSSTANLGYCWGSGAPTFSAAQGTFYLRTDGSSSSTRAYINSSGSTTWVAVTTGS